jgi:hypothetical protein
MQRKDLLEVVAQLNGLYTSMLNTLLTVVTIVFAVFGVAMPIMLTWYQNRRMRLEATRIQNDVLQKLPAMVRDAIEAELATLKNEVHRISRETAGAACHIQGSAAQASGRLVDAIVDFCIATACFLHTANHLSAQRALAELKKCASGILVDPVTYVIGRPESRDIQKFLELLKKYNSENGNIYYDSYNELNRAYDKLVPYPLPIEQLELDSLGGSA